MTFAGSYAVTWMEIKAVGLCTCIPSSWCV